MERISKLVEKALQERLNTETGSSGATAETVGSGVALAELPIDPFPCPACGQMLAPSCRVCVACKHAIDPAEIIRALALALASSPAPTSEAKAERVPYPWPILFAVLGAGLVLGLTFMTVWGEQKGQLAIQTLPVAAGVWVFFDAVRRRIPRPLRWGLGTMLLLAIIFPWYLARRNKPQARVPFVEAEAGPVARFLLIALLIFLAASMILYIVQGPRPGNTPVTHPQPHLNSGGSQTRVTTLHWWEEGGRGSRPGKISPTLRRAPAVQEATSAPSDARHT